MVASIRTSHRPSEGCGFMMITDFSSAIHIHSKSLLYVRENTSLLTFVTILVKCLSFLKLY